ncbi:MAG: hypothetical protein ACI4TW_04015 [Prevotella sp.]
MNRTYNRIRTAIGALALAAALTACSSDDAFETSTGLTAIDSPTVSCTSSTYRSLSFEWNNVDGAVQYAYTLTDADGNNMGGGIITGTTTCFDDLDSDADYTFSITAYPAIESDKAPSAETSIVSRTTLIDQEGTFTSDILSSSWSVQLKEISYNTFVVENWYGADGHNLEFIVNTIDNSIIVTNGTPDDATGRTKVTTGSMKIMVKNGVLIDCSNSFFYRLGGLLSLDVKASTGTRTGIDTLEW